jgi:hypothetical protein
MIRPSLNCTSSFQLSLPPHALMLIPKVNINPIMLKALNSQCP